MFFILRCHRPDRNAFDPSSSDGKVCRFRALVRSDAAAQRIRDLGGEPVKGDFSRPDTLAKHMEAIHKLFLLRPGAPDQFEVQKGLVDLAMQSDVESVVKLPVCTAEQHSPCSVSRWHWHNDEYLKASGVPCAILYPHTFMQNQAMQFGYTTCEYDIGRDRPDHHRARG